LNALGEACCGGGKIKSRGFKEGSAESMGSNWWTKEAGTPFFLRGWAVKEGEGMQKASELGWSQGVNGGVGCWKG
jgi:ribosome-associated protein YbcJ (S4-like RNA binding protein)